MTEMRLQRQERNDEKAEMTQGTSPSLRAACGAAIHLFHRKTLKIMFVFLKIPSLRGKSEANDEAIQQHEALNISNS